MDLVALKPRRPGFLIACFAVTALVAGWLIVLMERSTYDTWAAFLIVPIELLVSYPIFVRAARREGDPRLLNFLMIALIIKLAGTLIRAFVIFDFYGGKADAVAYDKYGRSYAEQFRAGNFDPGVQDIIGTEFVRYFTGIVYFFIGPSRLGGFFIFSWLGFWGLYLWFRAFRIGVPEGSWRWYGSLVFFLPSLVFWPSSVGKEAFLMFAVGLGAYGVARALTGNLLKGLLWASVGLGLSTLVRPHMAALMGVAATIGYAVRRSTAARRDTRLVRAAGLVVLLSVSAFFVAKSQAFFNLDSLSSEGVVGVLEKTQERSTGGASSFEADVVDSPLDVPVAVVSVVFRPFITEAHNQQALLASLEGTFLLVLTLARVRWLREAARRLRQRGFITFAVVYVVAFCAAFASVGNFGIIARQRVLMLPAFLALLAVPPADKALDRE